MLSPGQIVDRYTVDSILGSGGTAVVYLAHHTHLGTRHALKVMSIRSDAIRERMLREGRVQASLMHLNVVTVTDVVEVDGAPGLVMEYIEGPSLESALQNHTLSIEAAETLFQGILSGVRAAHAAGLVHRDLKPANVLLAPEHDGYVPKVMDFGLAKVIAGDDKSIGETRAGIAMGTPSYMAPEQIRDAKTVDQRADVFSLGCILYELMTAQRAFGGDQALVIYNRVTDGDYLHPRDLVPDLPDRVVHAIVGALAVEREARIPDCATLRAVLAGDVVWTVPDAPEPSAVRVPRSPRAPLDAPALHVAAREVDGGTPVSAPVRTMSPGLGLHSAVSSELPSTQEIERPPLRLPEDPGPVDGTLGGDEPFELRRSRGLAWLVGSLIGVVVLGLLALVVLGGAALIVADALLSESRGTPVATRAEGPPLQAVVEDVSPPPEPVPTTGPAEPIEVAPPPAPSKPRSRPALVKPAPVVRTRPPRLEPEPATAPAAPVQVKLVSLPFGAAIQIDGNAKTGRTPRKVELAPGKHQIELHSGDDVLRFEIDVKAGTEPTWCASFADGRSYAGGCP